MNHIIIIKSFTSTQTTSEYLCQYYQTLQYASSEDLVHCIPATARIDSRHTITFPLLCRSRVHCILYWQSINQPTNPFDVTRTAIRHALFVLIVILAPQFLVVVDKFVCYGCCAGRAAKCDTECPLCGKLRCGPSQTIEFPITDIG
jgi:hypothetical protein